jgi:acyl-coenzyme A synthetase/AMP-(fatty) acid ligase
MSAAGATPGNVAAWLPIMAAQQPDALAIAVANKGGGYARLTARQLDALCDRAAHALVAAGISKGMRTVLMVAPSTEFFAITFALFKIGAVPVMVDPGMGIKNLSQCLRDAEPEAFIGTPKAHAARLWLRWAKATLRIHVTVGPKPFWGGHRYARILSAAPSTPFEVDASTPEQLAAILFTSGSTGVPKGVLYTHAMFSAQVEALRAAFGIEAGEVDLSTFPLFALFGPALGMASVVPEMDASRPGESDPRKLVAAIHDFQCTNMFASPALVDLIGRYAEQHRVQLPSLRRVISAGAPASVSSLERLARHLAAEAEIFTPYGATESLPTTWIGSREILDETRQQTDQGAGVCVGLPVPGMDVAVIAITDEVIDTWSDDLLVPVGTIGEIVVGGPVVSRAYFKREQSTRRAKIDCGDGTFRHRMGDVGYLDAKGRLWMCGRKSHRVELASETLFTIPCEAIFNTHEAVFRSALVAVVRDGKTQPLLCVELEQGHRPSDRLTNELLALGQAHPHTRPIQKILYHPSFPVDVRHNAKIFREKLAAWAQKRP